MEPDQLARLQAGAAAAGVSQAAYVEKLLVRALEQEVRQAS